MTLFWITCLIGTLVSICYADFASKTPYGYYRSFEFNERNPLRVDQSVWERSLAEISERNRVCQSTGLRIIFRHGTRNPSEKYIKRAEKLKTAINSRSGNSNSLNAYMWNTPQGGQRELQPIANDEYRYLASYTQWLLKSGGTCQNSDILASSTNRTIDSAKLFLKHYCGTNWETQSSIQVADYFARFFDKCDKYVKEVDDNDDAVSSKVEVFEKMPAFLAVMQEITRHLEILGLPFSTSLGRELEVDDLKTYMHLCALDLANSTKSSPIWLQSGWCSLVANHTKVLEYHSDMENYFESAHAYPISYHAACDIHRLLFSQEYRVENGYQSNVTLIFGHFETLLPVLTLLKIVDFSEALTAENFETLGNNRQFRVKRLGPFTANLAIQTFLCGDSEIVYFLLNERIVKPSYCANNYCTMQEVLANYNAECSRGFKALCTLPKTDLLEDRPSASVRSARVLFGPIVYIAYACIFMFLIAHVD